jgi:3-hydroxybutyryl-CoA dehydrogenase
VSAATNDRARVGIVGAGTMGAGIAQVALEAGWEVALHDPVPGAVGRGIARIRDGLGRRAAKQDPGTDRGRWVDERIARLRPVPSLGATTEGSQLVIEAALEEIELKRALFLELDAASPPDAILATNTSALSVSGIAESTAHRERVIGLHFFNPAPVLKLVEVVAGRASAGWAVERGAAIVEGWGKTPIHSKDAPGFIVNRVNRPYTLEPLRLLRSGAGTIASIDEAIVGAGFPMGPFALMDLIGIDVNLAAARGLFEGFDRAPRFRPSPIQEELVAAGHLGRKSGEGFYRYANGERLGPAARFERPEREVRGEERLEPATIAERVILAIVNEAYRALESRVATADDIDVALRLGASHPFGPFEWVRRTGLAEAAMSLDALSEEDADTFRPALALLRAARADVRGG